MSRAAREAAERIALRMEEPPIVTDLQGEELRAHAVELAAAEIDRALAPERERVRRLVEAAQANKVAVCREWCTGLGQGEHRPECAAFRAALAEFEEE